ncbi:hypothetical protein GH733_009392, partial [Mirounga leonina]
MGFTMIWSPLKHLRPQEMVEEDLLDWKPFIHGKAGSGDVNMVSGPHLRNTGFDHSNISLRSIDEYRRSGCAMEKMDVVRCENHSPIRTDPVGSPLSEFRRCPFWEQELAKKYSYKMMAFLADEYYNYCQDILQNVRNQELERVEDLLTSFWKSLQQDTVMLMTLPDVCQLFKCYDVQLYKTMRMVLKNNRRVSVLKSDLQAITSQGALDTSKKALPSNPSSAADLETHAEMKCLSSLISLLGTSTDLSIFLNCLSSNLQTFVFQPSRSKEEFIRLAASFQLRWNFLLTTVSKAMTLCHRDSSWHLFHLLLLEFVTHLLQSCIEEEEEDDDGGHLKERLPDDQSLVQPDQASLHPPDSSPSQEYESPSVDPHWVTLKHMGQSQCPMGVSSVVLRVLGFLVDSDTGNKLIQVLLEDKAAESTVKLSLPVGQEALVTLKDGQKFVIHISDNPAFLLHIVCWGWRRKTSTFTRASKEDITPHRQEQEPWWTESAARLAQLPAEHTVAHIILGARERDGKSAVYRDGRATGGDKI